MASSSSSDAPLSLGSPLLLRCGQSLPNRLVKPALSECLADPATNLPGEELVTLYARWARGGTGTLVTGNVMIDRRWLESPANVALEARDGEDPRRVALYARWATAMRGELGPDGRNGTSTSSKAIMQISHCGRQCPFSVSTSPIAPSSVRLALPGVPSLLSPAATPRAMVQADIDEVVQRFADTARVAVQQAGFDGVQVHSAHGYLLSSFLSARFNKRTDRYGGSAENRRRLLLEVLVAVRASIGPKAILALKLNSADFQTGGFTEQESLDVIRSIVACEEAKVDFIECSGGTYENMTAMRSRELKEEEHQAALGGGGHHGSDVIGTTQSQPPEASAASPSPDTPAAPAAASAAPVVRESTRRREAYFLSFCTKVRSAVPASQMPLMLSGGWRSGIAMARAIRDQEVELIGLGRPLCIAPDFSRALLDCPQLSPSQLDSARSDVITLPSYSLAMHVPLVGSSINKTLEAGLENFVHQAQLGRMARRQEPDLQASLSWTATAYYLSIKMVRAYLYEPRRKPRAALVAGLAVGAGAVAALAWAVAGPAKMRTFGEQVQQQLLAASQSARQRLLA